ncbi:MAG: hypothetical protein J6J13_05300 [Clostridia bacterium]|nr:hypothetical protein [Clostridia bacterium]
MKDFFVRLPAILIIQIICVLLLAISILAVKFVSEKSYNQIEDFYKTEILSTTTADEVLKDGN